MRKYIEVAKVTFKSQIAYRFDVYMGAFLSLARILLAFIMWRVLYAGRSEIAGFTFQMMMTYYIISSFFRRLDNTDSIVWQMSSEIREGQFTKYMVRPVNPMWYFTSSSLSKTAYVFGINILTTIVWGLLFHKYFLLPQNPWYVIAAFIINFLGLNFMIQLSYFTAVLSFKFIDVGGLNMIKNNIIEFLTGTLIPLALLPEIFQNVLKFFPFYYVYYHPTLLCMNMETGSIPMAFTVLVVWNIFMTAVNVITYNRLKMTYEGVGI